MGSPRSHCSGYSRLLSHRIRAHKIDSKYRAGSLSLDGDRDKLSSQFQAGLSRLQALDLHEKLPGNLLLCYDRKDHSFLSCCLFPGLFQIQRQENHLYFYYRNAHDANRGADPRAVQPDRKPAGRQLPPMGFLVFNPVKLLFHPIAYGFGWSNTNLAIIVPFLASATGVFLFIQHFNSVPRSLVDSSRIDGTGPIGFIFHILIPMSWNTIGALALIQFVYVWNQYLWPRVIVRYDANQVVQVGMNKIISIGDSVAWGEVMAGAIIAMIPPLIIFSLLYHAFMKGYALSSNK